MHRQASARSASRLATRTARAHAARSCFRASGVPRWATNRHPRTIGFVGWRSPQLGGSHDRCPSKGIMAMSRWGRSMTRRWRRAAARRALARALPQARGANSSPVCSGPIPQRAPARPQRAASDRRVPSLDGAPPGRSASRPTSLRPIWSFENVFVKPG